MSDPQWIRVGLFAVALLAAGPAGAQPRQTTVKGRTFDQWIEALSRKGEPKRAVVEALLQFEDPTEPEGCQVDLSPPPLVPKGSPRHAAALMAALSDPDPIVRQGLALVLGRVEPGPAAIGPLTKLLGDPKRHVRRNAALALGMTGVLALKAAPALVRGLGDADDGMRANCAEALGKIGPKTLKIARAPLRKLIVDREARGREEALLALARLGDAQVFPILETVALDATEVAYARETALRGLVHAGAKALPAFVKAFADPTLGWERAYLVRQGLVRLGGPEAVKALRAGLNHANDRVQEQAIQGLGELGPASLPALPDLVGLLLDTNRSNKQRGGAALSIGGGLDPSQVFPEFHGLGPRAFKSGVPALIKVLSSFEVDDNDVTLPERIGVALARIGAPAKAALPTLDALTRIDPKDEDRQALIRAAQRAAATIRRAIAAAQRPTPR